MDYISLILCVLHKTNSFQIFLHHQKKKSMAMQRNYFTVLFFLKKSKLLKNGEAPICMRITINGKRAEVQIKRSIDVTKWNTQKECAIGREKKYQ